MTGNNLQDIALKNFDDLRNRAELLWTDTEPKLLEVAPIQFEFRIAPSYEQKPILSANDPGRRQATDPFGDDDAAFKISSIGEHHTLRLNKFCVLRPQFVLHTNSFEKQSDPLSKQDFRAAWQALENLDVEDYAVLYNCGAEAGSSIGHKHMQIIPKPKHKLFPGESLNAEGEISTHANVPFQHAILPIRHEVDCDVWTLYRMLCDRLALVKGKPHNVFFTDQWIVVVPRSKAKSDGLAANAASMLGLVWIKNEAELQAWKDRGPLDVLKDVGVPQ